MSAEEPDESGDDSEAPELLIKGLPERPDPSTWVMETPAEPPPDPTGGRNITTDSMLRNAGF